MLNFISRLFGKKRKCGKEELLGVLAYAISDVGSWSWFVEKLPDVVQVEFRRTMLYLEPKSIQHPPPNQIALKFRRPKSVAIIKQKDCQYGDNWLEDLRNDKLGPLDIDSENFSFEFKDIKAIIDNAGKIEIFFGEPIDAKSLQETGYRLGFMTREGVGMVISSDDMCIMTNDGAIALEQVIGMSQKWWDYWRKYWKVRGTDNALPYDDLCEITIPLAPE